MTTKLTIDGITIRTRTNSRYVAVRVDRAFDGVRYGDARHAEIFKRSGSVETLLTHIRRQGFHSSRYFAIFDTTTGERVRV